MSDNHLVREADGTISAFKSKDNAGVKSSFVVPSKSDGTPLDITVKAAGTIAVAADTAIVVDVRNYPAPIVQTATIDATASLSGGVALASAFPVGLMVPSTWTPATITFQGSIDGGATYFNLRTSGGSEVMVNVTTAGDLYTLNPLDFASLTHLKARSGTSATPVNQTANVNLSLVTRGAL